MKASNIQSINFGHLTMTVLIALIMFFAFANAAGAYYEWQFASNNFGQDGSPCAYTNYDETDPSDPSYKACDASQSFNAQDYECSFDGNTSTWSIDTYTCEFVPDPECAAPGWGPDDNLVYDGFSGINAGMNWCNGTSYGACTSGEGGNTPSAKGSITYCCTWDDELGYLRQCLGDPSLPPPDDPNGICLGSIVPNASEHDAAEQIGLLVNTPWVYSAGDTQDKCQYKCDDGYIWLMGSCVPIALAPTASLEVRGEVDTLYGSSVVVDVGETLDYIWSSTGGTTYDSVFVTEPGCLGYQPYDQDWTANDSSGDSSLNQPTYAEMAGCTYWMDYTVTGPGGSASDSISVIIRAAASPSDGVCSPATNGNNFYTQPTGNSNLCSAYPGGVTWTDTNVPFGDDWKWTCEASGVGADALCSAGRNYDATCGTSHLGTFTSAPSSNLCGVGTVVWTDSAGNDGRYNWDCMGAYDGLDKVGANGCYAFKPKPDLTINNFLPSGTPSFLTTDSVEFVGQVNNGSGAVAGQAGIAVVEFDVNDDGNPDFNLPATPNPVGIIGAPSSKTVRMTTSFESFLPGTYKYRFFADKDNVLSELNENNNYSTPWKSFTITAPPAVPDLTSYTPPTVNGVLEQGQDVTFSGVLRNSGLVQVNSAFTDNFTYCWGAACLPTTMIGGHLSQAPIDVGISRSDTSASFNLNQTGTLRVQHCIDSQIPDNINESDETTGDNCKTQSFNVTSMYSCTPAGDPANAIMCSDDDAGLTSDTPKTVVNTCSSPSGSEPKCQFTCNAGYSNNGGTCVLNPIITQFEVCDPGFIDCVDSSNDPKMVNPSVPLVLRWVSSNTDYCQATTNPNGDFSTGNQPNGSDDITSNSSAGVTDTYTIACSYGGVTPVSKSVDVKIVSGPKLTPNPQVVEEGDIVDFHWEIMSGEVCTLTGAGQTWNIDATVTTSGDIQDVVLQATTTFTLTCPTGDPVPATVEVVPKGYET